MEDLIMMQLTGSILRWIRSHKLFAIVSVIILFITVLVACGGSPPPATSSKYNGKIGVGLDSDAVTLDPLKSSAFVDRQVMLNLYDTLVRLDEHNAIVPDLASSWSNTSPTQLVFTLRTDVKFQDGTPFNADAVVFNINRILTTPSSPRFSELSNVQSVVAVDSSHVRFELKKPFSPLLATLTDRSGMMLSPAVVQKLGDNLGNGPVNAGSGPFMFSEWVKGGHLSIVRNPHYWMKDAQGNALPYLQSIRYLPITNESVMFSNLQTGTINVAEVLGPNDVASAKSNSSLIYKQAPALSFFGIMLNTKAAPFNNVDIRKAIQWGVNREEIVHSVLKDIGIVAQGPLSPVSWAYSSSIAPFMYNISNAKSELAQGGKPTGITFTLLISSGSPVQTQEAEFVQSELQQANITVNIKQETFATLLNDTDPSTHNFQAAILGWSGRPDLDGNMFSWFHTGGGFNSMLYSKPQVDALLEKGRTDSDRTQRATDYQQAEQMILNDASYVFINHGVNIQATTKNIQNFTLLPTGILKFTNV